MTKNRPLFCDPSQILEFLVFGLAPKGKATKIGSRSCSFWHIKVYKFLEQSRDGEVPNLLVGCRVPVTLIIGSYYCHDEWSDVAVKILGDVVIDSGGADMT